MTDDLQGYRGPEDLCRALRAADQLISRLEDLIGDQLARKDDLDEREAYYALVQALETAPEIATIRLALGDDPHRFGAPTPLAAGDHTG